MQISIRLAARRRLAAAVAVAVVCSTAATAPALARPAAPLSAVPVPQLEWTPCVPDSPFECATAEVPLDYQSPGGRTIELAVVKRKATGPGPRLGSLFFNPGGPGGPGKVQMPQDYEFFPKEVRERFDIVSWDPRGIGYSTAVNCFGSSEEAAAWVASKPIGFPVGKKERATWISAYAELGRLCEQRDPQLLRHVSTAETAQDLDLLRQAVGDPQLTYLGISYGTILGATYANMFPAKVRALVLDGNIDPQAWTDHNSTGDPDLPLFLRMGTDVGAAATLDQFLTLCGSADTAHCAFSAGSPEATRAKFDKLTLRLREHPVGAWTYAATIDAVANSLYVVHPGWTDLAGTLQDLWQGRVPEPPAAEPPPIPYPYAGIEQGGAVSCSDSPEPRNPLAYHGFEEFAAARSGDLGRFWTWAAEPCSTWPAVAANRYTGPWNTPTAHPILLVNPTYDPSTPIRDAEAMARELASARLLTLKGYGHTALLNPSSCVQAYESRYIIDGTLPPVGATCAAQNTPPFAAPRPHGGVATGGGAMAGIIG